MRFRTVPLALAIGLLASAAPCVSGPPEYRAKAEYLLLFLQYVTWPESAFPVAEAPLIIGVLGGDPFGALLDSACSGAVRQGRKIRVRRLLRAEEAVGSHVVFLPRGDPAVQGGWLGMLRKRPILTVAESERTFAAGAIIHLAMVDGHLRFDVNLPNLRESELRIDSPMLVSARRIIGGGGSG